MINDQHENQSETRKSSFMPFGKLVHSTQNVNIRSYQTLKSGDSITPHHWMATNGAKGCSNCALPSTPQH